MHATKQSSTRTQILILINVCYE